MKLRSQNLLKVSRTLVTIGAILMGIASTAVAESGDEYIRVAQLQTRLIGQILPATDPITVAMLNAIDVGGGSPAAYAQAAELLIAHPSFGNLKMRDFFAEMQNQDLTHVGNTFNRAVAFLVAKAVKDRSLKTIFTANETCNFVDSNGNTVDPNTATEAQLQVADFKTQLVCSPNQNALDSGNNAVQIPPDQVAGYLTLGGPGSYASLVHSGGTSNRAIQALLITTLGVNYRLETLRNTAYGDNGYIPKYVDHNPAGQGLPGFLGTCITCHALMGQVLAPFCLQYDYSPNANNGVGEIIFNATVNPTNSKCAGSNPGQRTTYANAPGYLPSTPNWRDPFLASVSSAIGNGSAGASGSGLNSLGFFWTNIRQVWRNFVERSFNGNSGVCPGIDPQRADVDAFTDELMRTGDIAKTMADIAAHPRCLGM